MNSLLPPAIACWSCIHWGVWVWTVRHWVVLVQVIYCSKGEWVIFVIWTNGIPEWRSWVTTIVVSPIFLYLTSLPSVRGIAYSILFFPAETLSGRIGKVVASHAEGCNVARSIPAVAELHRFILCTRGSGGTAHVGGGCDQSLRSTVSDAIVRS